MSQLSNDPEVRAIQQEALDRAKAIDAQALANYRRAYPNRGVVMIVFDADRIKNPRELINEPPLDPIDPMIRLYLSRKPEAVDDVIAAFTQAHERTT